MHGMLCERASEDGAAVLDREEGGHPEINTKVYDKHVPPSRGSSTVEIFRCQRLDKAMQLCP